MFNRHDRSIEATKRAAMMTASAGRRRPLRPLLQRGRRRAIGGPRRIDLATSLSAHFRKKMFRHEVDENPHPR
jgi:hypothetical protein